MKYILEKRTTYGLNGFSDEIKLEYLEIYFNNKDELIEYIENNTIIFEDTNLYEIKIYNLKEDRSENN